MSNNKRIIAIDPGNENSGVTILDDLSIIGAYNLSNEALYSKISAYSIHKDLTIVVEDIKPYSLKLTPQVIDTCKFIGELTYRLKIYAGLNVVCVARSDVRRWVYDTFPAICGALINLKIERKMYDACSVETMQEIRVNARGGNKRKGSFIYVDDKIVMESMKDLYQLKKPAPGKGYLYGLKDHSFQALALGRYYMTKL